LEKQIQQFRNIASLLQRPLTRLAYCQSLKMSSFCPYAGEKTSYPSIALSTALCQRSCHVNISSTLLLDKAVN